MSNLPTFTGDKLDEYLGIWNRLIERGQKQRLDITLTEEYGCFAYPFTRRYTLTFGEERRELTFEQALRVKEWLEQIARLP